MPFPDLRGEYHHVGPEMTPDRIAIAHHEAGHSVISRVLGRRAGPSLTVRLVDLHRAKITAVAEALLMAH
jgi:hypothetical protein